MIIFTRLDALIFSIVFTALAAVMLTAASGKMFQAYQLCTYRASEVFKWFKRTKLDYLKRYFALAFLSFVTMTVFALCFFVFERVYYIGALAFFIFAIVFVLVNALRKNKKTPLKITWRIKRLAAISFILHLAIVYALIVLGNIVVLHGYLVVFYPLAAIAMLLLPFTVTIAHFIALPIEKLIKRGFIAKTRKILSKDPNLIKIGITGSFGKTTVKNILNAFLLKKYRVLQTPKSFNTPMGISRAVGGGLGDNEVFIAEMGARYTGDIKELCDIVKPKIGILTGIGNQHLDTFGSHENLHKTKYALIESIPSEGQTYFNGDSEECYKMFQRTTGKAKTVAASGSVTKEGIYYQGERMTANGNEFTLFYKGESVEIACPLLGKHIPNTIAICAAVAVDLGVSLAEIAEACSELKPVPHRLQLIDRGDVLVIDNAYNSNVDGARNALEVLSKFDGVKIIVTPGLVELGAEEEACNIKVGEHIAEFADFAILNSTNAEAIKKGALSKGMEEDRIILANDLADSLEKLKTIDGEKKIILFENDLPDNF